MTMDFTSVDSLSSNNNGEFVLKLRLTNEASGMTTEQIRKVRLKEIFDPDHDSKPSYVKLVKRISFFLDVDIDNMSLTLMYTDEDNDRIHLSSSVELEHAIQQFSGQSTTTFEETVRDIPAGPKVTHQATQSLTVVNEGTINDGVKGVLPDLRHLCSVEYHNICFEPSRVAAWLSFDDEHRTVTKTENGWKNVYATEGYSTGCHYWSFKINDKGPNGSGITIGISALNDSPTSCHKPGDSSDPSGCSLYLYSGNIRHNNENSESPAPAELVKKATKIGVLLDMDHKTVSFYADGRPVGIVALTANKYYPAASLYDKGTSVTIEDIDK